MTITPARRREIDTFLARSYVVAPLATDTEQWDKLVEELLAEIDHLVAVIAAIGGDTWRLAFPGIPEPRRSWIDHSVTPPATDESTDRRAARLAWQAYGRDLPPKPEQPSIVCPYCGMSTQVITTMRDMEDRTVVVECVNPFCERNSPPDGAA